MQSGPSLRDISFSNADITLTRRDILIRLVRWILTIRNTVRLSRSFQDRQTDMAEDITPDHRAAVAVVTFVRDFFVLTVAVSAVAEI